MNNDFEFMWEVFQWNTEKTYQTLGSSSLLVGEVLTYIKEKSLETLIDIWTWSWSLALSIAIRQPLMKVLWTDINPGCLEEAHVNKNLLWVSNAEFRVSNYVDNVVGVDTPDVIIASLPYWNEYYLTPWNDIERLQSFPSDSYFHHSWDPFGCYNEMIDSILSKWRKTTAFIETGILPKELIALNLKKYPEVKRSNHIHNSTGYSTTKLGFL